jgi:8-oxo-dGTP diphosphatase
MTSVASPVEVAVAILTRPDGRVLLAQRPDGKVYSGYWEFPGGKVEPGEPVTHALARELHEELGIEVRRAYPWITRIYTYTHATVRLHFYRVVDWDGVPHCKEHAAAAWQAIDAISVRPLLPANDPVLSALALPAEYAISNASQVGDDRFLEAVKRRLATGLRLVQVREPGMPTDTLRRLVERVLAAGRPYGVRVLVNGDIDAALATGADGVQLTERQLMTSQVRPALALVGASCHSTDALRRAEALGANFAVIGPVKPTPTHPDAPLLGWEGFSAIAANAAIPVYAIGGLAPPDFEAAWSHGAHGLAMIRGSWEA